MNQQYSGSMTGEPFMLHENKIVAELLLKGYDHNYIKNQVISNNLFGYKVKTSISKRVSSILKRIGNFDSFLLNKIVNDSSGDGKVVILYSIYCRDRLFREFMEEFVTEKFMIRELNIRKSAITYYINNKAEIEDKINSFSEQTRNKLSLVFFNILRDAGLTNTNEDEFKLRNIYITKELNDYLNEKRESRFLKSIGASL